MDAHTRMIGILAALSNEIQGVLQEIEVRRRLEVRKGWIVEGKLWGKEAVVAITGMGRRAGEVVELLARNYQLKLLLSCGLGGGMVKSLKRGEAVICQSILKPEPNAEFRSDTHFSLLAARSLAQARIPFSWGRGLTVPRFISEPQKKAALAKSHGVQVVEMENFWVAKAASFHQIPFVAVRFISDISRDKSPQFEQFVDPWGKWQARKAASYFARHPSRMLALPGIFLSSLKARKNLKLFLKAYLKELDGV